MSAYRERTAWVITCSDTANRRPEADTTGPLIAESLSQQNFLVNSQIVPDEQQQIVAILRQAVQDSVPLVVCTGGTGIGPRDVTPEAIRLVADKELPGFGEALRSQRDRIPTADLSRAMAAVGHRTLIVALPGSPGGVRDGLTALSSWLEHALALLSDDNANQHDTSPHPPRHSRAHQHPRPPKSRPARIAVAQVTDHLIDSDVLVASVQHATCGATVTFEGRVRNHDHDRSVTRLNYEAHPDAGKFLAALLDELAPQAPDTHIAVAHRTGELSIGDLAFFVAVSHAHRGPAFAATQLVVEKVKERLPIWKEQTFADGSSEWVNCA